MTVKQFADQRRALEKCTQTNNSQLPLHNKEEDSVVAEWPLPNVFVISIRMKRLYNCLRRLGKLCQYVTIIPACNGENINRKNFPSSRLRRGQLGCFESHLRVWRYVIEHNIEKALILEDDASLYPNATVCEHIAMVLADLVAVDYDIVCLGRSFVKRINADRVTPRLVRTGDFYGLFAYVITRPAAIKLILHETIQSFSEPVDSLLSALNISGYLTIYACHPSVCATIPNTYSDTNRIK